MVDKYGPRCQFRAKGLQGAPQGDFQLQFNKHKIKIGPFIIRTARCQNKVMWAKPWPISFQFAKLDSCSSAGRACGRPEDIPAINKRGHY